MVISRQSLREQVRELLMRRIGRGEYEAGQRLVEAKLAEEMGISTVPVREAIRELAGMGVLGFEVHKGAWVREVSLTETIEALQLRSVIEPLAARLAGEGMRRCCGALRESCGAIVAAARARDFVGFQEHNQAFHRTIVEASGNGTVRRVWLSLAFEVRTRVILDFLAARDPVAIAMEHEPIVGAFEAGDVEGAAGLLATHSANLVGYLEEQREAAGLRGSPWESSHG
ncbi:MAG: GntR family transcriptional regulator [Verrucomicrobiae bacterium]|nr:GntR family transcriptional regulator [Verrucomicrobiae bacterium]